MPDGAPEETLTTLAREDPVMESRGFVTANLTQDVSIFSHAIFRKKIPAFACPQPFVLFWLHPRVIFPSVRHLGLHQDVIVQGSEAKLMFVKEAEVKKIPTMRFILLSTKVVQNS